MTPDLGVTVDGLYRISPMVDCEADGRYWRRVRQCGELTSLPSSRVEDSRSSSRVRCPTARSSRQRPACNSRSGPPTHCRPRIAVRLAVSTRKRVVGSRCGAPGRHLTGRDTRSSRPSFFRHRCSCAICARHDRCGASHCSANARIYNGGAVFVWLDMSDVSMELAAGEAQSFTPAVAESTRSQTLLVVVLVDILALVALHSGLLAVRGNQSTDRRSAPVPADTNRNYSLLDGKGRALACL